MTPPAALRNYPLTWTAALLTTAIFTLAMLVAQPGDGVSFLFVVPIAMVAVERGAKAGAIMAAIATAMLVTVDLSRFVYSLSLTGYVARVGPYFLTALLVGSLSQQMRTANAFLAGTVRSEQHLSAAILDTVGALVAILDPAGRVTYFNPASEKASGYRSEEVLGKLLIDVLMPPAEAAGMTEALRTLDPNKLPAAGEGTWLTKDGQKRDIRWSATALTDADGKLTHLIASGLDITDYREAERAVAESQVRLATFFDNAPSLLFWRDLEGRFVVVNKASEELLGRPRTEIEGRPASDFFSPDVKASIAETDRRALATGNAIQAEDQIETADGVRHFQTIKFPLRGADREVYALGGISTNITDLVEARRDVEQARRETVVRLARAVEYRDEAVGDHIERMSSYCELIARRLGFDEKRCQDIRMASAMHDAGKIAVPDAVLLKAGPLTARERAIMESHAEVGWKLLRGSQSGVLELAALIAYTHHERFDGKGYPCGLAGSEIPIEGRIAAVADVFDALTSDRVYRKAFPLEEALEIMRAERGAHFDPEVLDTLFDNIETIRSLRGQSESSSALPQLPPDAL